MLIDTPDAITKRQKIDEKLFNIFRTAEAAKQETRHAKYVGNGRSITNVEYQQGNKLTARQFERKLRNVNRDLILQKHPNYNLCFSCGQRTDIDGRSKCQFCGAELIHRDKGCIYLELPNGKKEFIVVCENDWMPEWSVMSYTTKLEPLGTTPGAPWKEVKVPYREKKRGWRTVLIRLIRKGLLGVEAVEKEFGAGERESWKVLTGKGPGETLI